MLQVLFRSENRERVLLFIHARGEAYASEIATFFDTDIFGVQRQLGQLEKGDILVSRKRGRMKLYSFNQHYLFIKGLTALLNDVISVIPPTGLALLKGEDGQ